MLKSIAPTGFDWLFNCAERVQGQGPCCGNADLEAPADKASLEQHVGLLVDRRSPAEFASGHILGTINLDRTANGYETKFAAPDIKQPVLG